LTAPEAQAEPDLGHDYEARAQEPIARPELYGLTPERAAAEHEADMFAGSYAGRLQARAESREPEPEPEAEL
jgi:hypothetical protein